MGFCAQRTDRDYSFAALTWSRCKGTVTGWFSGKQKSRCTGPETREGFLCVRKSKVCVWGGEVRVGTQGDWQEPRQAGAKAVP